MAISRSQLVKELEPGLNALFGLEYNRYENQHTEIFDTETSDYSIPLSFDDFILDLEVAATPTDPNATVEVVAPTEEEIVNSPNKATFTITCTWKKWQSSFSMIK